VAGYAKPRSKWYLALLAALGLSVFEGCGSMPVPWRKVPLDAATGFYQDASLVYRVDAGKLQQPLDVARIDGQTVSYEQVASSPLVDQSIGILSITYPHPGGRAGYAQVKFTLESNPGKAKKSQSWNPLKSPAKDSHPTALATSQPDVHESWLFDIPSGESDQFFKLLSSQGFYQTQKPDSTGVQLTVKINGKEVQKNWDQIPEFNALVQRVRREGQLWAYVRPGALSGSGYHPISSTHAYSDLLARTDGPDAGKPAANTTTSAFSMAPPPAAGGVNVATVPAVNR
jgi:hypothetical protein